jgi:hypothetical protein
VVFHFEAEAQEISMTLPFRSFAELALSAMRIRPAGAVRTRGVCRSACPDGLGLGAMVQAQATTNSAFDPVSDRLYTRDGIRSA